MLSRPALNNKIMEQKSPLLEKSLRTQSCLPRRQQPAVALTKVACRCAGSEKSFVGLKGGSQSRTHTGFVVLGARHLPYSLCQCWLEIPLHLAGGGTCKSEGLCHAAAGPAYQNQSLVLPPLRALQFVGLCVLKNQSKKNFLMTPGILNCGFWWLLENGALGREIPLSFKQNDLLSLGAFCMVFI